MKINYEKLLNRLKNATDIRSQTDLANALGIHRSAVTQAKKKEIIPDKWILSLSRQYGLSPEWLIHGKGNPFSLSAEGTESDFQKIPKVKAMLCAGSGSFEVGDQIEEYHSFQTDWLKKKGAPQNMVLISIFGNSMEPELKDGDTVMIDTSQRDILAGAIYAVGIDETIMVKRVEKHPQKLVLLSDNKIYTPIYLNFEEMDTVRIIGKVVWLCREFT